MKSRLLDQPEPTQARVPTPSRSACCFEQTDPSTCSKKGGGVHGMSGSSLVLWGRDGRNTIIFVGMEAPTGEDEWPQPSYLSSDRRQPGQESTTNREQKKRVVSFHDFREYRWHLSMTTARQQKTERPYRRTTQSLTQSLLYQYLCSCVLPVVTCVGRIFSHLLLVAYC